MRVSRREALRAMALGVGGTMVAACAPPRPRRRPQALVVPEVPPPPDPSLTRLAYGGGPQQYAELRVPQTAGPHPVAVVVHGGFWLPDHGLELTRPLCTALQAEGLATWNVEYRRIGHEGGGWPGTFLDVAAAADHLRRVARERRLDLGRVITLGHAAGGQLSLWLAGRRWIREGELLRPAPLRLRGAIALAGLVDLARAWALGFQVVAQLMGGTPEEVPERYGCASPAELLPLGVPQVLVHGRADRVVPVELSTDYQTAAVQRGDEARVVTPAGIGHEELLDPGSAAWPVVRDAVRSLL